MNHTMIFLSSLLMLVMVAIMAPTILARNKGRILRNTAIWLAIFVALGLFYKHFGPGRTAAPAQLSAPAETQPPAKIHEEFTPPKE